MPDYELNGYYSGSVTALFLGSLGGIVLGCLIVTLFMRQPPQPYAPRLIGTECDNASGPLYADEEDYFPANCTEIHGND